MYLFVEFAVMALALARGGRDERFVALLTFSIGVAYQLVQFLHGAPRTAAILALHVILQSGFFWLLHRRRDAWVWALALLNLLSFAGDMAFFFGYQPKHARSVLQWAVWWGLGVLAYLQLAIIAGAVLRRHFGPPYPVPARLAAAQAAAAISNAGVAAGTAPTGSAQPRRRASR